jgi:thioredoxin 1
MDWKGKGHTMIYELLNVDDFYSNVICNTDYALVEFSTEWCSPCKQMQPVMNEAEGKLGDRINFYRVRSDDQVFKKAIKEYQVMGIPLFILFFDGNEISRRTGYFPDRKFIAWLEGNLHEE